MGVLGSLVAPACVWNVEGDDAPPGQGGGGGAGPAAALAPVREVMEAEVAAGQMPGAVWLIARGGDVHVDAAGVTEIGGSTPMRRDTIFRIASMTKVVTATAVMMLVEEGKLDLDAPVDRWLPELANRRVLARIDGPIDETVPAERPITVRDLMTFTMGFGLLFDASSPIQRAIDELQLVNGQPVPMTPHGPDEWIRRLGTLPLMHQPGAQWMYNTGSLVQGVLVRRVADQDFDVFVRERILAPLGMRDTDFHVPADKLDRFAGCGYFTDPATMAKTRMDRDGAESAYASPPVFPSGAGGLMSTVDDYLLFARMLANGGVHEGRRILSAASVREMTTDRLTPAQKAASSFFPGFFETHGWGHGLAVVTAPDAVSEVPGRYGWDGGFGTSWINDPSRELIGIVMTQSSDFLFSGALERFWRSVYVATQST
ncbi:serine hydrolase domain-containing protein [Sorangium sp. So ce1078]|uniref:serine hydrolase domain-containing protein n=1 Tax=Sorangium sp. So ce1078 TaxID=3133329 RepID=UPI003F61372E